MKRFLLNILIFAVILAALSVLFDIYLSHRLKESHQKPGEFEVWNDIYNGKINAEIAVYGSSRSWVHIDPTIIRDSTHFEAYNFGIDGHNFWLQYLRHLEYLKYNPQPKYIVLAVDVFSLVKREDLYQASQFLPNMLWNFNVIMYTKSYNGFDNFDYYLPLIRFYGRKKVMEKAIFEKSTNPIRHLGYRGIERKWNNDLKNAKRRKRSLIMELDQTSILLFERFLQECRQNSIQVILVYTPEYIEGQNYITNRQSIISMFDEFSEQYKLPFLNYSNDSLSFKKDNFYNASHLNKKGSELFSRKLGHDLQSILDN